MRTGECARCGDPSFDHVALIGAARTPDVVTATMTACAITRVARALEKLADEATEANRKFDTIACVFNAVIEEPDQDHAAAIRVRGATL